MTVAAINSSREDSWTVSVDTFVLVVKDLVSIESHCVQ